METKIIRFVYGDGSSITGYRCSEAGDMSGEYVRREDHEAAMEQARAMALDLPAELHPNTADLVRRFAVALGQKLREAEVKYGYADGWMDKNWANACRLSMVEHVNKGDPRDVAIYAAFLWHHGWHASLAPFFAELNTRLIEALGGEAPPTPLLAKLPDLLLKMRKVLANIATVPLRNFEDAEEFRTWARSVAAHALPGSPALQPTKDDPLGQRLTDILPKGGQCGCGSPVREYPQNGACPECGAYCLVPGLLKKGEASQRQYFVYIACQRVAP